MPRYIGYEFTGTANSTVVNSALNNGVTDKKYNSGVWSIGGSDESSVYGRRRGGNWLSSTRGLAPFTVDVLVVAGGAAGGASQFGAGGGGAGGKIYQPNYTIEVATPVPVTIGAGGTSAGSGNDSTFGPISATGGGAGGVGGPTGAPAPGTPGGSGGGGGASGSTGRAGGSGTPGQGNGGGSGSGVPGSYAAGGGGGGGSGSGSNGSAGGAGPGGTGYTWPINSTVYAGGGAGSSSGAPQGSGGPGGGGPAPGTAGTANLGGGGGAGPGGNGGSGVVVVAVDPANAPRLSGGTQSSGPTYTYFTFNSSGTLTVD